MKAQIPWLRVFVEGVVIVVSILLAFGIEAWWDGVQDRQEEQEVLRGLASDFTINVGLLRGVIIQHQDQHGLLIGLEAMSDSQLAAVPSNLADDYATAIMNARTFDPRDGTLEAVISSGRLSILDSHLRDMLMEWKRRISDVQEEADEMRLAAQGVLQRETQLGGPWRINYGSVERLQYKPIDMSVAAHDSELMGLTRQKQFLVVAYLNELGPLAVHADSVLTLIDADLAGSQSVVAISLEGPVETTVGGSGPFAATSSLSDGSSRPVTFQSEWTSSDTSVVMLPSTAIGRAVDLGSPRYVRPTRA